MGAIFAKLRKHWNNQLKAPALVAVGLAALSGCEPTVSGTGPTIDPNAPVKVALMVPRGSAQGGDALLAESLENAARLAIADLQGVTIDLQVYDTAGDATVAAARAAEAVGNGAQIILGPVYGEAANAVGLAVRGEGINVLSFSNNASIAGGNLFVMGPTFDNTARRLTQFAASVAKGNMVVVHSEDVAGAAGRNSIEQAISATSGASLVGSVSYPLSQQGVIDSVPVIRDTALSGGANAVFLTSTTSGALPLYAQTLPESGLSGETVQYIGLTRWDIPAQTLSLSGLQGGWFALPDPTQTRQFSTRYSAAYGGAPHSIGSLAFDGIAAIGALVASGDPQALSGNALTQSSGFQGVGGVFRLLPDGTNERGLAVAAVQNNDVVIIDPAPTSFASSGF
jgi:hypothetical protein